MPVYGKMAGRGPVPEAGVIVPQELCATGLLIFYRVLDRATNLVANVDVMLVDQARMESMTGKRDEFLEMTRQARVETARKTGGKPVLWVVSANPKAKRGRLLTSSHRCKSPDHSDAWLE